MDKIKKFFSTVKVQLLLIAIALIVVGTLFIIFPKNAMGIICRVSGIALIIWGVVKLVGYFSSGLREVGTYSLVGGITLVAFGILLVIKPTFVSGVFTLLFGILLIIDSVMKIQQSVDMCKLKIKYWWVGLIIAAVTLAIGIIIFIDPFASAEALMIYIGVSLIVDGVIDLVSVIFYSAKIKKIKERESKNITDI